MLSGQDSTDASDADVELSLLAAAREAFRIRDTDRLRTGDLLAELNGPEEAPWQDWNDGKGLRPREFAKKLRPYGIKPKKIRIGHEKPRQGYLREGIEDACARYLPPESGTSGTMAQTSQESGVEYPEQGGDVPDGEGVGNAHSQADVPDVPDNDALETDTYAAGTAQLGISPYDDEVGP